MNGSELTIIVPVYNEEQILTATAMEIIRYCSLKNWPVIFINDGSLDHSGRVLEAIAGRPWVTVIHHKINRGYGGAIKTGIRRTDTPYLATMDADGQHSLEDVDSLLAHAKQTNADLVVGNRGAGGNANRYRAFGKRLIYLFARLLMPMPIQDLNSGLKLYRTELARRYIKICPDTMAFSDVITLAFINQKNLVLEKDITIQPRMAGKSTINTYTALDTVMAILNMAVLFNPLRVFLPVSLLCILAGLVWGISRLLMVGQGVSVGAMLAIVTGIIFFVLGLLANQISAMRMEQIQE